MLLRVLIPLLVQIQTAFGNLSPPPQNVQVVVAPTTSGCFSVTSFGAKGMV